MRLIRKRHKRSKEQLKQLLINMLERYGLNSSVNWNDFEFNAKSYGTTVKGEIFDNELHIEIRGIFEKVAEEKLRQGWKELVTQKLV